MAASIPARSATRRRRKLGKSAALSTKRPDIDNLAAKAALDACNGVVWRDDSQVVDMTLMKRYSLKPRIEITVTPIRAEAA